MYETLNHPPTQQEEFDSYWEATLKFQEYKVEDVGDVEIVDEEMETILYHDSSFTVKSFGGWLLRGSIPLPPITSH